MEPSNCVECKCHLIGYSQHLPGVSLWCMDDLEAGMVAWFDGDLPKHVTPPEWCAKGKEVMPNASAVNQQHNTG